MKLKSILSAVLLATALTLTATPPRYIFYFIGDGMGIGHVHWTDIYARSVLNQQDGLTMLKFPVAALCTTRSVNRPVTDSTAAGTALATGHKTLNNMMGMTPDTVAVPSIAEVLHKIGYGVGLVTTVAADDATPGAFYGHVPSRNKYYQIGKDAIASDYEFIAGSRWRADFSKKEPKDLPQLMEQAGIVTVHSTDEVANANSRRVMVTSPFAGKEGHPLADNDLIGHVIDSMKNALTLPAMTQACLDHLLKYTPDRFFMMVEGGSIDWAAHANDGATVVMETLGFDQSLRIAYEFYLQHPHETLIVVTADHETGGMSVSNTATKYQVYPQYVQYQRVSKEMFTNWCRNMLSNNTPITWEEMKQYLTDKMGFWTFIPVSDEETEVLKNKFNRTFITRNDKQQKTLYNTFNEFAVEVFDIMARRAGFGWSTTKHTGNPVPVYAIGDDASLFGRMNDNTDIPRLIMKATGIKF